jgi:hypothetical protein
MNATLRLARLVAIVTWLGVAPGHASDPVGAWSGTYTCYQGETALDLVLYRDAKHRLHGEFHFSAVPSNPDVPEGCYTMNGAFDTTTGALTLRPAHWLLRPENYLMVGLEGTVLADGTAIEGVIAPPVPGCTRFEARSVGVPPSAPAACHPGRPVASR